MSDPLSVAREVIVNLEQGEVAAVLTVLTEERRQAVGEDELRRWTPALDKWIGAPRQMLDADPPTDAAVVLQGPNGRIHVRVQLDSDSRLVNVELTPMVTDGIRNIVIGAPQSWNQELERVEGGARDLAGFYGELLGMTVLREDWMVIGRDDSYPRVAFGDGWSDERPPRWPDPDYPHHLHLDISVGDLDRTEAAVLKLGARMLREADTHRTYADPLGHPFCLYPDPSMGEGPGRIARLVFDCPEPHALASFWAGLLDMPERIEDSAERVVIASPDGAGPMLAFQRVDPYVPPRWGDPMFPQRIHLDLMFNDHEEAKRKAEQLGAGSLPPPRGSCPVYADPAGHPFCLCSNGGGDETYVARLFGES